VERDYFIIPVEFRYVLDKRETKLHTHAPTCTQSHVHKQIHFIISIFVLIFMIHCVCLYNNYVIFQIIYSIIL